MGNSLFQLSHRSHLVQLMVQLRFFIIFVVFLVLLSGCMQKATVTYVPHGNDRSQVEKSGVTSSEYNKKISSKNKRIAVNRKAGNTKEFDQYFRNWEGVRYRYGGKSSKGIDCSGLTQRAYKDLYDLDLPRTVTAQSKRGEKVNKQSLRPGDLVFFKTGLYSRHVGIYLGENRFIHASRSKGVIQSNLNNTYWRKKYWQAKRYQSTKS